MAHLSSGKIHGTLYAVATPIGNLQDLTYRAVEVLKQADLIACEDTRRTSKLLNHLGISRPMTSYHEFNEAEKADELVRKLEEGLSIALVSDAGTPTVSDPGYRLIRLCRQRHIPVIPVPGPSAAMAALSVSGLPSDEFLFLGFLPSKKNARRQKLIPLRNTTSTLVFFEAPHRIEACLADMEDTLGDREVFIAREMTKVHEEYWFGRLSNARGKLKPIGEFVVILAGTDSPAPSKPSRAGLSQTEALRVLAERLGMSRNQVYSLLFKKKEGEP